MRGEAPTIIRSRPSKSDLNKEDIWEEIWVGWCECEHEKAGQEHFQAEQEELARCSECNKFIKQRKEEKVELTQPTEREKKDEEKKKQGEEKKQDKDVEQEQKTFASLVDAQNVISS